MKDGFGVSNVVTSTRTVENGEKCEDMKFQLDENSGTARILSCFQTFTKDEEDSKD